MKKYLLFFLALTLFIILAIAITSKLSQEELLYPNKNDLHHEFVIAQAHLLTGFDLVDPEQAPPEIRKSVLRGYQIISNTSSYAPNYVKGPTSCTNCHFTEGDTLGGRDNGFSLVGVTTQYPRYSKRTKKIISLEERVNYCFERSLNGLALPLNSQEMEDIINYLKWISHEVQHINNIPWLGYIPLKSKHQPNLQQGAIVYQMYCALCHHTHGQGGGVLPNTGKTIPPLWGPYSFNDGAGMSRLSTLSAFVYWNMPYQYSFLTEEQAIDVSAFILNQPRPHFIEEAPHTTQTN